MRTRWTRVGERRYVALNERKVGDGAWRLDWQVEYLRADPP
jgi:hypothetical protein